jgi:hypothetical protein
VQEDQKFIFEIISSLPLRHYANEHLLFIFAGLRLHMITPVI